MKAYIHVVFFCRIDSRLFNLTGSFDTESQSEISEEGLKTVWTPQIWLTNSVKSEIMSNPDLNLLGEDTQHTLTYTGKVRYKNKPIITLPFASKKNHWSKNSA